MKRLFGLLSIMLVLSVIGAACAQPEPEVVEVDREVEVEVTRIVEGEVVTEVVTEVVEVEQEKGGDLVLAFDKEPTTIDPNVNASWMGSNVISAVCEPLIGLDREGNLVPALATEWEVSDDLTSMTFKLREGVMFHDGTPWNAEALKFNFDRIADPATESMGAIDFLGPYDRTEVVDEYTATIYWSEPYPFTNHRGFFRSYFAMNSPTAVEEYGEDYGTEALVCSGPYMFKEWVLGDHITVEKNPDYDWELRGDEHPPYLDSVTWKYIEEAATRTAVLQTGEVDLIFSLPPERFAEFAGNPDYDVQRTDLPGIGSIFVMSPQYEYTQDVRVRQALEYAVDREAINLTVYNGLYTMQYGPLAKVTPCSDEEAASMYSYDPDKAKALLADAGWTDEDDDGVVEKDGEEMEDFTIWSFDLRLGEVLQAQLAEIGIEAMVQDARLPVRMEKARAGDFGMMILAWRSNDPAILQTLWHSSQIGGWNFANLNNPEVDALLDEGGRIVDMEKRCEIYGEVQRILMEEAVCLPMNTAAQLLGYRNDVRQVRPAVGGQIGIDYYSIYIEE